LLSWAERHVQHADVQLLIILVYSHSQQHQGDNGVSATRPAQIPFEHLGA
jgi:hypothetical protein